MMRTAPTAPLAVLVALSFAASAHGVGIKPSSIVTVGFLRDVVLESHAAVGQERQLQFGPDMICAAMQGEIQEDGQCKRCEGEGEKSCCFFDMDDLDMNDITNMRMDAVCDFCDDYCGYEACGTYTGIFAMATLSIDFEGCTNFETGPWTGKDLCFDFTCVGSVDGSQTCECSGATFDTKACTACDFSDVPDGGTPRIDCGEVGGPNQQDMDKCLEDMPVASPVAGDVEPPVAAPTVGDDGAPAPTVGEDGAPVAAPTTGEDDGDMSPPTEEAMPPDPTSGGAVAWDARSTSSAMTICLGIGWAFF